MKCADFANAFGLTCEQIKNDLSYLQTTMTDPFGGNLIGFYAQDLNHDRIRLSDNADTLFSAMCAGIKPTTKRGQSLAIAAEKKGVNLSDHGELHLTFHSKDIGFYVARFIEAMLYIGTYCESWLPTERQDKDSLFEKNVREELRAAFPGQVKTDYEITGASGNQLKFNFAIAPETPQGRIIQVIPIHGNKHYWPTIYSIVGKMMDVKNIRPNLNRYVIIENSKTVETARAGTIISECANVIQYNQKGNLKEQLIAC